MQTRGRRVFVAAARLLRDYAERFEGHAMSELSGDTRRGKHRPDGVLADRLGRRIDYLRVSVTDRCDLRCSYCIPKGHRAFADRRTTLSVDEWTRLVGLFADMGTGRVRLTGGEPLVHPRLVDIAAGVAALPGVHDISLSTNGTRLAEHAAALARAGVRRLNVSLDTLRRETFAEITGRDALPEVLRGLTAARAAGFVPIKVNMVLQAGINDREVGHMVDFCRAHGYVLRLIERMPVGSAGPVASTPLDGIRRHLVDTHGLVDAVVPGGGPARYLRSPAGDFTVGFITPMSQHFCATCNRLRLGADGALYTCLDARAAVPLGERLRAGANDDELRALIAEAVWVRPAEHEFTHADRPRDRRVRPMAVTGG
jgi:cyclic pyranopterin phosphate synthase